MDEKEMKWYAEVLAQYKREQDALIQPKWAVGFKDRGMGHGDFAVIVDGTMKVVVECPSKEVAEHIVEVHNKELKNGKDAKGQAGKTQGKGKRRQPASSDRKSGKR